MELGIPVLCVFGGHIDAPVDEAGPGRKARDVYVGAGNKNLVELFDMGPRGNQGLSGYRLSLIDPSFQHHAFPGGPLGVQPDEGREQAGEE